MTTRQLAANLNQLTWLPPDLRRLPAALLLLGLCALPGAFGGIARTAMIDAYVQVSVFVAATLFAIYGIEKVLHIDVAAVMEKSRIWQVPTAAALGAMPGCGGAIFVVAAYSRQRLGFGAVLAALTATMGDAAFLLLATRPVTGATVIAITFMVGVLSGWFADAFLRDPGRPVAPACLALPRIGWLRRRDLAFAGCAVPGFALGIAGLAQIEFTGMFGTALDAFALFGAALVLLIWTVSPVGTATRLDEHTLTRTAEETSFVTIWVVVAFMLYEYAAGPFGLDLAAIAETAAPVVPLLAVLVGFIPGCGPQVLMTALYLNGVIPFAALIGNAISNDGDALFPALVVNRRAAILATLYSAVPALLVAYGVLFFGFEP